MRVLITGTTQGIGRACAMKFIECGHEVFGMDVLPASITHERYKHFTQDIRDELPDIEGIDILVNNAGIQDGDDVIGVNLLAPMKVTEKYAFREGIKAVVFTASSSASNGAEFPMYAASKGGLVTYMKYCALHLAKYGCVVNSISPGGVVTSLNEHILCDPVKYQAVKDETMLGKWAQPEEIADLAYFLCVVNKSMTGQDLLIDNGEMLKSNFIW